VQGCSIGPLAKHRNDAGKSQGWQISRLANLKAGKSRLANRGWRIEKVGHVEWGSSMEVRKDRLRIESAAGSELTIYEEMGSIDEGYL